jgi:hypothetical protein
MDTLIKQSDLKQYDDLEQQAKDLQREQAELMATPAFIRLAKKQAEISKEMGEIKAKLVVAATKALELGVEVVEEGKSKKPNLDSVTEPGVFQTVVAFGTTDSPSWKGVVDEIKKKSCVYMNGGPEPVKLNSVLASIINGQTTTTNNVRVKVQLRGQE